MAPTDLKEDSGNTDVYPRSEYYSLEDVAECSLIISRDGSIDKERREIADELRVEVAEYLEDEYNQIGFNFDARSEHCFDDLQRALENEITYISHQNIPTAEYTQGFFDKRFFQLEYMSQLLEELEEAIEK